MWKLFIIFSNYPASLIYPQRALFLCLNPEKFSYNVTELSRYAS